MRFDDDLWLEYGRRPRPDDIGEVIDGIRIGDVDDEIQDVLSSWEMGPALGYDRLARLGLAVANAERIRPAIQREATGDYFDMLITLGRRALEAAARGELDAR